MISNSKMLKRTYRRISSSDESIDSDHEDSNIKTLTANQSPVDAEYENNNNMSTTPKRSKKLSEAEKELQELRDYTPETLEKRDTASVEKAKRSLALEKLKEKRKNSLERKSLSFAEEPSHPIDYNDNDLSMYNSSLNESEESPVGGDQTENDDQDADEFNYSQDSDDSMKNFIVEDSSQSQSSESQDDSCAEPTCIVIKNGDFIASRELNENNTHDFYQVVGTQLNWYMMLKTRKKFISSSENRPVADEHLDDYVGPIPVSQCPPLDENSVVEIEKELSEVCNALILENGGKPLKLHLEAARHERSEVVRGFRLRLSREDAHVAFVECSLRRILDISAEDETEYFDEAEKVIKGALEGNKGYVSSNLWGSRFMNALRNCPLIERDPLEERIIKNAKCQACRQTRHLTECLVFYQEDNGEKITPPEEEFSVGCYCADRAHIYHELHHYDFEMKQSCIEKVNMMRSMRVVSAENILQDCLIDHEWLDILWRTFKAVLAKAEAYAVDGESHREMKARCATYN